MNKTFYTEDIVKNENEEPIYEISSMVTVKKLRKNDNIPEIINIEMSINNTVAPKPKRRKINIPREIKQAIAKQREENKENEDTVKDMTAQEIRVSPQPSTSGVDWKALRHDRKSWRSSLSGEMKPEASVQPSSGSEEADPQIRSSTPKYRSAGKETSVDEEDKIRTKTILRPITEVGDSDESDEIRPKIKRRKR